MILSNILHLPSELQMLILIFASPFVLALLFLRYIQAKKERLEYESAKAYAKAHYEQALHELLQWKQEHPNMDVLDHRRGRDIYFTYIWAFNQYRPYDPFFRDARAPKHSHISEHT